MFEWDKSKARKNQVKHGVSFADTFAVFEDPNAVTLEDPRFDEQWQGDNIRIISARKAVRSEVRQYESEI